MTRPRLGIYLHSPLGSGHARRLAAIAAAWAVTGDVVWLADRPQGAAGETVLLAPAWSGQGWPDSDAEARLARRGTQVATWLDEHPIDLLVLEYYPFGRRAYGPELAPVVAWAHGRHVPTVVSVRDVIGKPLDGAWVPAAVAVVNARCAGILWHGDAPFLPWDFPAQDQLRPPVWPTGYVSAATPVPMHVTPRTVLAVAGSGARGLFFGLAALAAARHLAAHDWSMTLVTGHQDGPALSRLAADLGGSVTLLPWLDPLAPALAAAQVILCQGGYNAFGDVMAAGRPAVLLPFGGPDNTEQESRCRALAAYPGYRMVAATDPRLAESLTEAVLAMGGTTAVAPVVAMDGAVRSADRLRQLLPSHR